MYLLKKQKLIKLLRWPYTRSNLVCVSKWPTKKFFQDFFCYYVGTWMLLKQLSGSFCRKSKNSKMRHCLIDPDKNQTAAGLIRHLQNQNQAADWLVRWLPDQNQGAWLIRHLPNQNQAAAWLIRRLPDQIRRFLINQAGAWLKLNRCLIDQTAARLILGSCIFFIMLIGENYQLQNDPPPLWFSV